MSVELQTIDAVECVVCKKLLRADSENYVVIYGNVCIGRNGGMIGNNLDENGRVVNSTCVCRTMECLNGLSNYLQGTKDHFFGSYKSNQIMGEDALKHYVQEVTGGPPCSD